MWSPKYLEKSIIGGADDTLHSMVSMVSANVLGAAQIRGPRREVSSF